MIISYRITAACDSRLVLNANASCKVDAIY